MWDWLRSPQTIERREFGRNLTPHSQDALMDAIRTTLPPEGRPGSFAEALSGGTLDQPSILQMLLARYRARAPQPQASQGGGGGMSFL